MGHLYFKIKMKNFEGHLDPLFVKCALCTNYTDTLNLKYFDLPDPYITMFSENNAINKNILILLFPIVLQDIQKDKF